MPAEVASTSVLRVGNRAIVNTGSGDDAVEVRTESNGEVVITVNGTDHKFPPGTQPVIRAGDGDDVVRVAPGTKVALTILGGQDDDELIGGSGADTILGGTGDDKAFGGAGVDALIGGRDNDRLIGGAGDDRGFGGHGNDRLDLGSGKDRAVIQTGDSAAGAENVVRVEYQPRLGSNFIKVVGTPEFVARVDSDLEALRSMPGNMTLTEYDKIHAETAVLGPDGKPVYQGDTLVIQEGRGLSNYGMNYLPETHGRTYQIFYDPGVTAIPEGEIDPATGLYHEHGHVWAYARNAVPTGDGVQADGTMAPNKERAVTGLDTTGVQPKELTENQMREWLGRRLRANY